MLAEKTGRQLCRGSGVPPSTDTDADYVLRLFSRCIALGTFFHGSKLLRRLYGAGLTLLTYPEFYAWTPGFFPPAWINLVVNWLGFAAAALAVVVRPNAWTLSVWAALSVSHFFAIPQRVPNHYLLLLLAALVLAGSSVAQRLDSRARALAGPAAIAGLRHLLLISYAFAFLHKLNWSYLDPASSPLHRVLMPIRGAIASGRLNAAAEASAPALIAASLLVEASIPLLLMSRRLRRWGFAIGGVFHGLTTMGGAQDYSMVILTFYLLFLPPDGRDWTRRFLRLSKPVLLLHVGIGAVLLRCSYLFDPAGGGHSIALLPEAVLTWALLTAMARMVTLSLFEWPSPSPRSSTRPLRQALTRSKNAATVVAVVDLLYVINCMGPYLGFKSEWSQAMFSGLSETGGNHLFIPRIIRNDPWVHDLKVSPRIGIPPDLIARRAALRSIAEADPAVESNLFFSLLSNLCKEPGLRPIGVSYRRAGAHHDYADICVVPMHPHPFNLYPW